MGRVSARIQQAGLLLRRVDRVRRAILSRHRRGGGHRPQASGARPRRGTNGRPTQTRRETTRQDRAATRRREREVNGEVVASGFRRRTRRLPRRLLPRRLLRRLRRVGGAPLGVQRQIFRRRRVRRLAHAPSDPRRATRGCRLLSRVPRRRFPFLSFRPRRAECERTPPSRPERRRGRRRVRRRGSRPTALGRFVLRRSVSPRKFTRSRLRGAS